MGELFTASETSWNLSNMHVQFLKSENSSVNEWDNLGDAVLSGRVLGEQLSLINQYMPTSAVESRKYFFDFTLHKNAILPVVFLLSWSNCCTLNL